MLKERAARNFGYRQTVSELMRLHRPRASKPPAIRMQSTDPQFKSHSKAVIIRPLGVAGIWCVGYALGADGSGPSSPNSTRLVVLMDLETGSPVAIIDEHNNYTLRTAASVAVAAKHLHPDSPKLGLIGAGGLPGRSPSCSQQSCLWKVLLSRRGARKAAPRSPGRLQSISTVR